MAQITESLFGLTPEAVRAQQAAQLERQALAFAQLSPMQAAQAGLFRAGNQLGGGIAGLMGYQDPEVLRAQQRQGMLSTLDINNPNALLQAAETAQRAGDFPLAQALQTQALDLNKQIQTQQTSQTKAATEQRALSGRQSFVKRRYPELSDEEAFALASDEKAMAELVKTPKTETQVVDVDGRKRLIDKNTGATIADLGTAGKTMGQEIAGGVAAALAPIMAKEQAAKAAGAGGTAVGKEVAQVEGKFAALDSLQQAADLLKAPDGSYRINAGIVGPEMTFITKATGGLVGDRQKAINSERFLAAVNSTVIPMLQEFGGNDSNEELKYLQGVAGGNIRLEPESLDKIIESAQRKIRRGIERVQRQQQAVQQGQPLPTDAGPSRTAPAPTLRFNPQTGKLERL